MPAGRENAGRAPGALGTTQRPEKHTTDVADFKALRVQPPMLWSRRGFLLAAFTIGVMDRRQASRSFVHDSVRAARARRAGR